MQSVPRKVTSYNMLEKLGRVRLSEHFFMRDFLYSEIANHYGIPNFPTDPKEAVETGTQLCVNILEPLREKFGHIHIRSAYRSPAVNKLGNEKGHNCGSNESNYGGHIWDMPDSDGHKGATACIQVTKFADDFDEGADWRALAWWIHDHLPYSSLYFFPKRAAFNITWSENPIRCINSYVTPKGCLTKPGMDNWAGDHSQHYSWLDKSFK